MYSDSFSTEYYFFWDSIYFFFLEYPLVTRAFKGKKKKKFQSQIFIDGKYHSLKKTHHLTLSKAKRKREKAVKQMNSFFPTKSLKFFVKKSAQYITPELVGIWPSYFGLHKNRRLIDSSENGLSMSYNIIYIVWISPINNSVYVKNLF